MLVAVLIVQVVIIVTIVQEAVLVAMVIVLIATMYIIGANGLLLIEEAVELETE